ncbi:restriction endonuclease [Streptomyces toyocaensis]|uniref:restriction endonuclease n=1 Tax=Streptomyces toyocaensis TaxID=55952 RepID=UPI003407339E
MRSSSQRCGISSSGTAGRQSGSGTAGDQAADVIGRHAQRGRIVLQAKHTTVGGKADSELMYQVKGTAGPVNKADVAAVVTNGGFTGSPSRRRVPAADSTQDSSGSTIALNLSSTSGSFGRATSHPPDHQFLGDPTTLKIISLGALRACRGSTR